MERADVIDGKIAFAGASPYEMMVLPNFETMTPEFLEYVISLVERGAKVIGSPPLKSPSLTDYPNCDNQVKELVKKLWTSQQAPDNINAITHGKGKIYWGGELSKLPANQLYPSYKSTVEILSGLKVKEDFISDNHTIRFGHRKTADKEIYFVANRTNDFQTTKCTFRAVGEPELWLATTGHTRKIENYSVENGLTTIILEFFPFESFFVTFSKGKEKRPLVNKGQSNFPVFKEIKSLTGEWNVSFNPKFGGL